jgi:hypothetical protein
MQQIIYSTLYVWKTIPTLLFSRDGLRCYNIHFSQELCPTTANERENMSKAPYTSAIGPIMYAMTNTRPDVSYAISATSRHQANPGEGHWTAVEGILKYLRSVGHLFSNVVNQDQVNTILKGQGPSSSEALSPFRYNNLQTKVMKDMPS